MSTTSIQASGPRTAAASSASTAPATSAAASASAATAVRRDRPRRDPLAAFRGFPEPIWVIFTGVVVNRIGFLVGPFLVFFLGSRGVSARQTPFVLGALGAGNLVGPALGGWLADNVSRRSTMVIGLTATAAAQGLLFESPDVLTLALSAAALSVAATMVSPAGYAVFADNVGPDRRREAYALLGWAINIGTAIAGVLGGYLAAHGYWSLFAIDAGSSLVYAAIVLAKLPDDRAERRTAKAAAAAAGSGAATGSEAATGSSARGYGVVFHDRLLMQLLLLFGVQLFIYSLTESALPLAIRTHGLPPSVMGLAAAVNAGLIVLFQPFATSFLARFPRVPVYIGFSAVTAIGVALTGLAGNAWQFALTVVVWSLGELGLGGIAGAVIADMAPSDARGRYQGAFSWAWGASRFLALTAGTAVYTLVGPGWLWWSVLVAGLAAAAATGLLVGRVDARVAAPAAATAGSEGA